MTLRERMRKPVPEWVPAVLLGATIGTGLVLGAVLRRGDTVTVVVVGAVTVLCGAMTWSAEMSRLWERRPDLAPQFVRRFYTSGKSTQDSDSAGPC